MRWKPARFRSRFLRFAGELSILMKTSAIRHFVANLMAVLSLTSLLCVAAAAQQSAPAASKPADTKADVTPAKPALTPEEKKKADLRADTEKLYVLTQELKDEVAKSNKDTLSVGVIRKAQEIERLAKSIKERSRNP
jgi:hypothetical protein